LLSRSTIQGYQRALPSDIALLGGQDLAKVGPINLVITGWPCQGHTRAGHGEGLRDPRSRMFWEMLRVLRHLQTHHARAHAYILENVPLLGDIRSHVMANVHKIRSWNGPAVLLDAARVGLRAHRPRLWWTNFLPKEVLRWAYEIIPRSSHLIVDSILDIGRRSQVVRVADRSPMAVVNRVGQPRMALPTFVSFLASHAYREGGPGLVWDTYSQ
jgi:site-specific DNA-cytosine methylase